jgi:hypothetical protein
MHVIWGVFIALLGFIGWGGQVITMLSPKLAAKLLAAEPESEVDPVFAVDFRAEATWDSLIQWNLLAAGILLIINNPLWVYFGLFGGSTHLYISGRGILQRVFMSRRNIRIGRPSNIRIGYLFLSLWGMSGAVTIILALNELIAG